MNALLLMVSIMTTPATFDPFVGPADHAAKAAGYYFDHDAAAYTVEFFERFLRHSGGRWVGQPFRLLPWQDAAVRRLYGWKRPDGLRRFREAYIEVPKKNGKTTFCAGLALYHLVADGEAKARVYCAACDRQQAGFAFDESAAMVQASQYLRRHLKVIPSTHRIAFEATGSVMVALSADAYTKEGLNASAYIIDELHAHRSPALFDTLRYAGAARSQPLGIYITTAGHDRQSICYRIKGYAEKVRDGVIVDHAFFALIYGASGTDDIDAPATWRKANPSMGETIREEDFARELAAAKATTGTLNKFLRYRLNIWTESATAWIDRDAWDACGREPIDLEELEGVECHAGLDLSSTRDLTAFVPVFGDMETGLIAAPKFWLPGESAARRQEADRVPYLDWVRDGHIETCGAECIDEDQVFEAVMGFHAKHPIRRLYSDPWHAQRIARKFQDAGIDVQFMRQGPASMTAPMKELERLVMTRRIHHGGNPVLRWNADNVVVKEHDGGAITPSKSKSREKIDGITALIAAVASVMDPPTEGSGASVYATRGVVTLETPEVATHAEA